MIVVADSGPLHYLILLEQVDLLRRFYGQVLVPQAVANELSSSGAPTVVRDWMTAPPSRVEVRPVAPDDVEAHRRFRSGRTIGHRARRDCACRLAPDRRGRGPCRSEVSTAASDRHLGRAPGGCRARPGQRARLARTTQDDQFLSGRDTLERGLRSLAEALARDQWPDSRNQIQAIFRFIRRTATGL